MMLYLARFIIHFLIIAAPCGTCYFLGTRSAKNYEVYKFFNGKTLKYIPDRELGALVDMLSEEKKRRDELREKEAPFDEYEE